MDTLSWKNETVILGIFKLREAEVLSHVFEKLFSENYEGFTKEEREVIDNVRKSLNGHCNALRKP